MVIALTVLACLGLIFGSFVNALVWRTHQQTKNQKLKTKNSKQLSIFNSRSQCVHCGHVLSAKDLVPVLSWLALRGRCRYCQNKISWQYPAVEIALGLVFALSYYFWFNPVDLVLHSAGSGPIGMGQWTLFVTWLAASVGLLSLAIYDIRWMMLPNSILYPTAAIAASGRLIYIVGFEQAKTQALLAWLISVVIAGGIFWLIYELSHGKAIGFGDVRLGLISGTVLASPLQSLQMIFLASVLGTIAILPGLLSHRKNLTTKVPYGPFLITATFIVLLFGVSFTDWYQRLLV